MTERMGPSEKSTRMRENIGKQLRGALTAGFIATAGMVSEPIVFQGFDDAFAAKSQKGEAPKKQEKSQDREWGPHDITPFVAKMRTEASRRILAEGNEKEILNLLAEQPLIKRMRDPLLSNAELGRFYPRERPMVDPNFPKSNVEGVRDASITFIPIRYRTRDGKTIRRGGTRVGKEAVLLTYRTAAERAGRPILGTSFEEGFNASVTTEVFGDGYENAPIVPMRFSRNADVHMTYGTIVGAPKEGAEQKARLEGDGGLLVDLSQTPALRKYLVQNSLSRQDPEAAKKLDRFLSKSVLLVSSGSEDDETDDSVRKFQDGSDGWQVFSAAKGIAPKGDTTFSFAGIHAWTIRILDAKGRPRFTGYVVTGPEAIQEAQREYAKKQGNRP